MRHNIEQIYLNKIATKKIKNGYPWIFFDSINNPSTFMTLANADIVHILDARGNFIATAIADITSKLALRIIDTKPIKAIDKNFFKNKINHANLKREKISNSKFYRLINYEGDNLPGLCIERFGNHFKIEANLEFYHIHKDLIVEALLELFDISTVVIKYDLSVKYLIGDNASNITVEEQNSKFYVDLLNGQKTGWYFDQRQNRAMVAQLAKDKIVLDCFCYSGGFGINALTNGAKEVSFIDSSHNALQLLKSNLQLNKINDDKYNVYEGNAINIMRDLINKNIKYDVIILDPPPLIKNKINKPSAIKKYFKIGALGFKLLNNNGYLLYSSCSHYMKMIDLKIMLEAVAKSNGCSFKIINQTRHPYDHSIHPQLPQSEYLNSILIQVN